MFRIDIYSAQHSGPVAYAEADENPVQIGGSCASLIDSRETLLELPSGRRVTAQEDPREWARGRIVRFRSADLSAQIVHDDDPFPDGEGAVSIPPAALG